MRKKSSIYFLIYFIYFLSGICMLTYEVLWFRMLQSAFGNTFSAFTIIMTVFLAGLALGADLMGKHAEKVRNRLKTYALIEFGITISSIAFPFLLQLVNFLYKWIFNSIGISPVWLSVIQIILSSVILFIPTILIGAGLPLLGRHISTGNSNIGKKVGGLYAVNILGAVLGCLFTGFIFIRIFGVYGTLLMGAGLNLLIVILAGLLSRLKNQMQTESQTNENQMPESSQRLSSFAYRMILTIVILSGLIGFGYEIIWIRSASLIMGGTTYIFSTVLAIYLLASGLGALTASSSTRKFKNPVNGFGFSMFIIGIYGLFYFCFLNCWHSNVGPQILHNWIAPYFTNPAFSKFAYHFLAGIFLFFVPSFFMGFSFPFILQIYGKIKNNTGESTGAAYSLKTIGSLLASLLVGFIALPLIGMEISISILALTAIWSTALLFTFLSNRNFRKIAPFLGLAFILTSTTGSILLIKKDFLKNIVHSSIKDCKLLEYREDLQTVIGVHETESGMRQLTSSGLLIAANTDGFRVTQKVLGHVGFLLNKNAQSIFAVGYGSGESIKNMTLHEPRQIDVAEISPQVPQLAARYFRDINLGRDYNNSRINLFTMDAVNYLSITDKKYDLIVSDAIYPQRFAGNSLLYSREYFEAAKNHLNEHGLMLCWIPIMEIPVSSIESILGTFYESFPYIQIWYFANSPAKYNFLLLIGSEDKPQFSPAYIEQQLADRKIKASTEFIQFYDSQYILSSFITDQDSIKSNFSPYSPNKMDRPFIEFNLAPNEDVAVKNEWLKNFLCAVHSSNIASYIDWQGMSESEKNDWISSNKLHKQATEFMIHLRTTEEPIDMLYNCYRALQILPTHEPAIKLESELLNYLKSQAGSGKTIESRQIQQAINRQLKKHPDFATGWLIQSWIYENEARPIPALSAVQKAAKFSPKNELIKYNLGLMYLKIGKIDEAENVFKFILNGKPQNALALQQLAAIYEKTGNISMAIEIHRKLLTFYPNDLKMKMAYTKYLRSIGREMEAEKIDRSIMGGNQTFDRVMKQIQRNRNNHPVEN